MKKILFSLFILLFINSARLEAQAPQSFKYQGVARTAGGDIIKNQQIALRLSVLKGGAAGTIAYSEIHTVMVGDFGVFSLNVGQGAVQSGDFINIGWSNDEYWLSVEMDPSAGNNFQFLGSSRLLSVPYALHAETVSNRDDADADPTNEIQTLSKSGNQVSLSKNGGTFTDEVNDADADPANEIQLLSRGGDQITLSKNGGTVSVNDADASPTNELQTLSFDAQSNTLSISDGNFVTIPTGGTDADADPTNEIQMLSKSGNQVSLSKNGGTFTDEVNDADADPVNEIQNLSLSGNILTISGGNTVDFSPIASPWQKITGGILYDDGVANAASVQLSQQLRVGTNAPSSSTLNNAGLYIDYTKFDSTTVFLQGNLLKLTNDKPFSRESVLRSDSLYFFKSGIGLLFNSESSFSSELLKMEYGTAQSKLTPGSLFSTNGTYNSELHPWALTVEEKLSPSDIFTRFRIEPDSLTMWNSAKWQNAKLGTGPDGNSGELRLLDGGGLRDIVRIGSNLPLIGGGYMHLSYFDTPKVFLDAGFGNGAMWLNRNNDAVGFCATSDNFFNAGGYMCVADSFSLPQVEVWTTREVNPFTGDTESAGHLYSSSDLLAPLVKSIQDGNRIVNQMASWGMFTSEGLIVDSAPLPNDGSIVLLDPKVEIGKGMVNEGTGDFYGTNGSPNVRIGGLYDDNDEGNHGFVWVFGDNFSARAGMEVDAFTGEGIIWGDVKNFRMDHPAAKSKEIWYASLEGPEAAAYVRGSATLHNGEAFVPFPEHFTYVANPKTMTVILTPQSADTYGLAVIEKKSNGIRVKELKGGIGNFDFDWEVKCVRAGYEDYQVVREKKELNTAAKPARKIQNTETVPPSFHQDFKLRRSAE